MKALLSLTLWSTILSIVPSTAFAEQIPGQEILDYFTATCPSQGDFTRKALSDARSLMSILDSIKNDEACTTVAGAISQLGNLSNKLSNLENQSYDQRELARLEGQEVELMNQLSTVTDPVIRDEIQVSIRSIQVEKAGHMASIDANRNYSGNSMASMYSQIVNTTNAAFSTVVSNYACLDKNSNILPAVTGLTSSIAASSSLINPALGLGLATASDFIGVITESIRQGRLGRRIRYIADGSTALEGYKCALESLTNRWCELTDAENFLKFKAKLRTQTNDQSGLLAVVKMTDRDIPVLLDWLSKIRAGVPASSSADASRQNRVFGREAMVRSANALGYGVFAEERPLFDSIQDPKSKYSVLRSIINKLVYQSGGESSPSGYQPSTPLSDIYNYEYAPYYLLGLGTIPTDPESKERIPFSSFDPFTQWPAGGYTPDIQIIMDQYFEWINIASQRVNQELRLVFQPDAISAVSSVFDRTGNKWKISAKEALINLIDFLDKNSPHRVSHQVFTGLYKDTLRRLRTINELVENAMINRDNDFQEALKGIFEAADLQFGTVIINGRLDTVVRLALDEYFASIKPSEQNQAAQLLAANSFLEVLKQVSGTDNLTGIAIDIRKAKPIAMNNMISFSEVFGSNINRTFRKNQHLINSNDPLISEAYKQNRAEFCFLLASLPQWPIAIPMNYCYGLKLESIIPGGPVTSSLDSNFINQPFSKRACIYRNFIRASKIYQDWGIKLPLK